MTSARNLQGNASYKKKSGTPKQTRESRDGQVYQVTHRSQMERLGQGIQFNGPKKKALDPLKYLKFALRNCRKKRLRDEYLIRLSNATKIKVVNSKGSIFNYSVTNSKHSDDSEGSDSDDEDHRNNQQR